MTDIISISDDIGGLPLPGLGGALGSGGIITFEEPSRELSADDLFAEGRHTDYGLSLRTEAVTKPISDVVDRALQSDDGHAPSAGRILTAVRTPDFSIPLKPPIRPATSLLPT